MYDLFSVLLDSVCQNFVKDFCIYVISDIGLQFSFFVGSLSGFGIRVMVASQNEFGSLPSSAIFCKSLSRIDVSSSLNFCLPTIFIFYSLLISADEDCKSLSDFHCSHIVSYVFGDGELAVFLFFNSLLNFRSPQF